MQKRTIASILKEASQQPTPDARIEFLRRHDNPTLRTILVHMFHPDIEFLLPPGAPPYKPSEFDEYGNLYQEARRLYLFVKGGNQNLTKVKRESLFIDVLQYVHKEDAELLIAMKVKKSPYKTINLKLIQKAFPGLVPT